MTALGGTARVWRVDRMATAVIPGTNRLNPQFPQMATHYGADVAICPAHRPQRKGVVSGRHHVHRPALVAHRQGHLDG